MPLLAGATVGLVFGVCAVTHNKKLSNNNGTDVNWNIFLACCIESPTFQQGTLGPAEIVNMRVAEEIPLAKNCGVKVKMASKT